MQSLEIVFVGTGVSTAIPVLGHFGDCACKDAIANPHSKNKRNNVSLLLAVTLASTPSSKDSDDVNTTNTTTHNNSSNSVVNVLIDCGKTFRQAYFETLVKRNIHQIDALLLTHDHADAVAGLDDLRDLQPWTNKELMYQCDYYVPTYLMPETLKCLEQQVGYIVRNSRLLGQAPSTAAEAARRHDELVEGLPLSSRVIERRSTALNLWTVPSDVPHPFSIAPLGDVLPCYSIPVEHGKGYMCLGFAFGTGLRIRPQASVSLTANRLPTQSQGQAEGGDCVVYLSDVSAVPSAAMAFLLSLERLDYLVIDLLLRCVDKHFSHFTWNDMWELVRVLNPRKVYGVGMYCDFDHEQGNIDLMQQLKEEQAAGRCIGVESVELAYDGLPIHLRV